jgi:hypothetical protein
MAVHEPLFASIIDILFSYIIETVQIILIRGDEIESNNDNKEENWLNDLHYNIGTKR